jgi:hypothetical protein
MGVQAERESTSRQWSNDKYYRFSFQFPAAISSDLRRAAVLCCVTKTTELNVPGSPISLSASPIAQRSQYALLDLPLTSEDRNVPSLGFDWRQFREDYTLQMSNSGEYLLVMQASSTCLRINPTTSVALWLLRIYKDLNFQSSSIPNYVYTTSVAFKRAMLGNEFEFEVGSKTNAKYVAERHAEKVITFHPYLPMIAFAHGGTVITEQLRKEGGGYPIVVGNENRGTMLWDFSKKGDRTQIGLN